jgi:hypothetical protein
MFGYIGSPVLLVIDPADSFQTKTIGISTLNICYVNAEKTEITKHESEILNRITRMLETHLRATWEGDNRVRETRVRGAISDFLDEAFADEKDQDLGRLAQSAVRTLKRVLEVEDVCVVDVREVHVDVSQELIVLTIEAA